VIAILDTEGVGALAATPQEPRARLRVLRRQIDDVIVPAAVFAEGLFTGNPAQDVPVHRFLRTVEIPDVTERMGRAAGALRQATFARNGDRRPSGVDAIVAAIAGENAAHDDVVILTSDPEDFVALARGSDHVGRIAVEVV
jgi:predicted nucleic acid-binding protein